MLTKCQCSFVRVRGTGRKALCVFYARDDSRAKGKNAMCLNAKGWVRWLAPTLLRFKISFTVMFNTLKELEKCFLEVHNLHFCYWVT